MFIRPCPHTDGPARSRDSLTGWRAALALTTAGTLAAAGCASSSPQPGAGQHGAGQHGATPAAHTASFPHTPAGTQASWLFGAEKNPPIPVSELTKHFDSTFLTQVPAAKLSATLAGVSKLQLDSVSNSTQASLAFEVTANGSSKLNVSLVVDSHGLISGLLLKPAGPPPTVPASPASWSGVTQEVRSVAPQVHFLAASVDGGTCRPIQAIGANTPAPLGSAFKLYVLDALARAIAAGQVSWNQQLTVTSAVKSLPSGTLQNEPDGTKLSVRQVATDMISISDNTAANMLIALVGRGAVEAAARDTGMADPSLDVPFLNTSELFVLKLDDWPKLADRYLAQNAAGRQAMLSHTVDHVSPSTLGAPGWTAPRDIGSLEWFASPTDICHVYASLAALAHQPKLAPLAQVLEKNPGDVNLPSSQWQPDWFKGGSEPGVLTLNYLATTRSGHTYLVSEMAANPATAFAQTPATLKLISAARGAFALASR
jgi:hypothetical protein